jgi:hypothetical protein
MQRMSRERASIHPTYLVLLNVFVDTQALAVQVESHADKASERCHADLDAFDVADCKSVRDLARRLGVATTTASILLKRSGYADQFALKSRDETGEAILRDLEMGQSVETIARRHRASPQRVYRLMREAPGLIERRRAKHECAELEIRRTRATTARLKGGRVMTVSEFRTSHRRDYLWLFKNDKTWLRGYLATLTTIAPKSVPRRTSLTADAVKSETELLNLAYETVTKHGRRRPYRASRQRVADALALNDYAVRARKSLGTSLPSEPDEQFVVRRLRWASEILPEMAACSSTVRLKTMGLRDSKSRRAVCANEYGEELDG